jgi:hypothetical protein
MLTIIIGTLWILALAFGLALCWAAGMEDAADEMRREHGLWRGMGL